MKFEIEEEINKLSDGVHERQTYNMANDALFSELSPTVGPPQSMRNEHNLID